jgi:hypothetical protein
LDESNLQLPHLLHRHNENGEVRDNVGHRISDEECPKVDTGPINGRIPRPGNGTALEDSDEYEYQGPEDGNGADNPRGNLEALEGEDAAVHDEDGYLDESEIDEVYGFVCKEHLGLIVSTDMLATHSYRDSRGQSLSNWVFPIPQPEFPVHYQSLQSEVSMENFITESNDPVLTD